MNVVIFGVKGNRPNRQIERAKEEAQVRDWMSIGRDRTVTTIVLLVLP